MNQAQLKMTVHLSWLFCVVLVAFMVTKSWAGDVDAATLKPSPPVRVIESFSQYKVGSFPRSFRTYPFQRGKAKKVYHVESDGSGHYLKAFDDQDISVQILREFVWNIDRYPWISWKWRARELPTGADERQSITNDSACGVYLIFGKYTGKALKYVWSSSAPVGTVVDKKPGKMYMIVKDSGIAKDPKVWQQVIINVPEDYLARFGNKKIPTPTGFGILTDGNAVHAPAGCDYADFKISMHDPLKAS